MFVLDLDAQQYWDEWLEQGICWEVFRVVVGALVNGLSRFVFTNEM